MIGQLLVRPDGERLAPGPKDEVIVSLGETVARLEIENAVLRKALRDVAARSRDHDDAVRIAQEALGELPRH